MDTVVTSVTQGDEPTSQPEVQQPTPNRDELKTLLKELAAEIKDDKLSEELVTRLENRVELAKNDFIKAIEDVKEAILSVKENK